MPTVEVTREHDPAPAFKVEACYKFAFNGTELVKIELSKRKVNDGRRSQFDKADALPVDDVPSDVIGEAQDKLRTMAAALDDPEPRIGGGDEDDA